MLKFTYWQCEQWKSIVLQRRQAVFDTTSALLWILLHNQSINQSNLFLLTKTQNATNNYTL